MTSLRTILVKYGSLAVDWLTSQTRKTTSHAGMAFFLMLYFINLDMLIKNITFVKLLLRAILQLLQAF